jgi:uncharacterized protein YdeI (YjbR/CyaY-like superfamily)
MDDRMNPKVDEFLSRVQTWQEEFAALRTIALDCPLTEEFKWGAPCYTFQKKNVVLIHGFKEYCALLFFKGALLRDPEGILIRQTDNVQAGRQIRFTSVQEIATQEAALKAYILEAIEIETAGLKVSSGKGADLVIPGELQDKLAEIPAMKEAFEALTPGRQRAYVLYFSQPKQAKTREARVEKCTDKILSGKGLDD